MKNKTNLDSNLFETGVIIGRFQINELHEGHLGLIDYVSSKHKKVILFIGVAKIQNTKKNPLSFSMRKNMIQELYPNIIILPLLDQRFDSIWSNDLDKSILSVSDNKSVVLYGCRDSFIPSYNGIFKTIELESENEYFNASDLRNEIAKNEINSKDFRNGVIFQTYKNRAVTYPTVDVVVVSGNKILLARKPNEEQFRFIGGFVDRSDESLEMAARRELYEESKLSALTMHYVLSQKVEDWRYRGQESGILTTLFLTYDWDQMGRPIASDDIEELKYFDIEKFNDGFIVLNIVEEHRDMMKKLIKFLTTKTN
jgi:bifunctional NMN adenylyltransferase/nudix hydrolase